MRNPVQILTAAADLITPKGAWTQKRQARDRYGRECHAFAQEAVSWCLIGAICKIASHQERDPALSLVREVLDERGFDGGLTDFNDGRNRSKLEVIALLREAARKKPLHKLAEDGRVE